MILQQPDTVSLSGNIKDLIFSSTEEKEVVIQLNDVTVYSGRYTPDNSGNITVKLSDIIPTLLTVPAPNSDDVSVTDISRIVFVASGDNSGEFYCVKGGVSGSVSADTFLRANFLTWQPQILKTFVNAPIFIRYASLGNYLLKVKAYFHDGSNETKTIYNCIENKIYTFNVSFQVIAGKFGRTPSYFDIWVSDSTGEKVSFIQRYALSNYGANDDLFLFENTLGGIDTICFSGVKKEETEVETLSSMQGDDLSIDYDIDFSRAYTKNIGYFPIKILRGWVSEFFRSTQRYHVTEKGIEPIVVSNSNIASEKYVPSSYSFTFAYSKKENYLNFPRLESPPEVVDIIDPDHTVFSLAPRLYEFPLADVGADPLIPVQHPFTDTWRYLPISAITRLENEGGGGSDIDIIKTGDTTPPTENNVFSALRSLGQFHPKGGNESLDFVSKNNTISGDLKVGNNTQIGGNVSVGGTTTTLNAIVQRLATIYDLDVTHVATLFNTVIKNQLSSENFISGFTGEGMKLWKAINGDWNLEIDNLTARKAFYVFELILQKIRSINGALAITQGNGTIKSVSETTVDPAYYVCEIEGDMTFEAGDFVRCQVFSASRLKYYWVKVYQVTGNSIFLLKSDFSTDIPESGDEIVQIGNDTNTARQSVLYLSASEDGKPRFSVLDGVNSPSFVGKTKAVLGYIGDIVDSNFPAEHQPSGYGLYCPNAFISGFFVLSNGKSVEDEIGNINTQIIAIPGLISSSVTEEVSKIEIGGRNLAINSDFSKGSEGWYMYSSSTNLTIEDNVATISSDKVEIIVCSPIDIVAGEVYTVSAEVRSDNLTSLNYNYILGRDLGGSVNEGLTYNGAATVQPSISSEWKKVAITFTPRYTQKAGVGLGFNMPEVGAYSFQLRKFKLEKGNKATDWSPAPEDAKNYTDDAINNIQIGGRNLLKNSDVINLKEGVGSSNYSTIVPTINFKPDRNYVLSVGKSVITSGTAVETFTIRVGDRTTSSILINLDIKISKDRQIAKFTTPSNLISTNDIRLYLYTGPAGQAANRAMTLYEVKLEEGDKATDWTSAPEDIQAALDAANEQAQQAKEDAAAANEELSKINSDNIISPVEKTALKQQQADIQSEYDEIIANAGRYEINTDTYVLAYTKANNALIKYTALTPEYITISSDYQDISAYYTARQELLDGIATAAKLLSDEANQKIDNLQIGARNLVLKSDQIFTARISSKMYDMSKTWLSLKGKTVAISFDYSYANATTDSSNHILWFEQALDTDTGTSYALSRGISLPITSAPISGSGRYTGTAVVPSNIVSTSTAKVATLIIKMTGGSGTITNFKIEEGTKATDWTPAPEDVQAELDSKVAVTVYESGIQILQSSIDSKVSQTDFNALGNRVSAVETEIVQTPNKITQAIKETSIGGDNLLPNLQQRWARGRFNSSTGAIEVPSGTDWSYVRINIYCAEFFPVNGGETLVFSAPTDYSYTCFPAQYDASKKFIPVAPEQYYMRNYYDESYPDNFKILTLKPQTRYVRWQIQCSYGSDSGDFYPSWFATNHAQVEIGTKPSAYKTPFTDVTYTGIDIQQGKIWLTADKVEITGELIAKGISTGGINVGNGNCIITSTGLITAKGATIEGEITATSGSIGGVSISDKHIGIDSGSSTAVGSFLAAGYLGVRSKANYFRVDANDTELQCTINKQSDTTPCIDIKNTSTSGGSTAAMAMRTFGKNELYGGIQILSASATIIEDNAPKLEITKTDFGVTLRVNNTGEYVSGYLRITSSPATGGAATVQFVRD